MSKISILHISDLHKIPDTNYESLVQSLLDDRNSYMANHIMSPNYIVVSGDIIQGNGSIEDIRQQYAEANTFLERLCHEFLQDDKSRILIVPGNHDVSYPDSKLSMSPEPAESRDNNLKDYKSRHPNVRWKWDDFSFYKITDGQRYAERFHLFIDFYNSFYGGIRQYPMPPTKKAECIMFPKDRVSFVLFNSCDGLDHLNSSANIDEEAISSVMEHLRNNYNLGYLNIGVWHHHFYGEPHESNYLSRERIATMSHRFIRIGMFGHQHRSQVAEFYSSDLALPEGEDNDRVLLISSGTLFGGARELPYGCKRQYNIVEIDIENGEAAVNIHVREDHNVNVQSKIPYWGRKDINAKGCIEAKIMLKHLDENEVIARFIRDVKTSGDYKYGIQYLQAHHLTGGIYDTLRSEFVRNINDDDFLMNQFTAETANDYMLKISLAIKYGNQGLKNRLIADPKLISLLSDPVLTEMYKELSNS